MPRRDDIWLKSFISRICQQIEEYREKPLNYVEVQALIQRFVKNNPDADREEIERDARRKAERLSKIG